MATTTATPMHYIDQRRDAPSGESLRVADAPLGALVKTVQRCLNPSLAGFAEHAMRILGHTDVRVDVRWSPSGIIDDRTAWDIVEAKVRNGVPEARALAETGIYEPDEIDGWLKDRQVEMDVARRVGLLSELAAAVTQLGQGMSLGLLDEAQAREVIRVTVGQLTPEVEGDPAT